MRKLIAFVLLAFASLNTTTAQTALKEYKAGHVFFVSLPEYMTKTGGINSSATIQFKNVVKDVAGFIIEDNKEELKLVEMNYTSLTEFYDDFIKDFLKEEQKRVVSTPISKKVGTANIIECDVTYYDAETKTDIYYYVGIVETSSVYYKVICWASLENKQKFKSDFQKIAASIRD